MSPRGFPDTKKRGVCVSRPGAAGRAPGLLCQNCISLFKKKQGQDEPVGTCLKILDGISKIFFGKRLSFLCVFLFLATGRAVGFTSQNFTEFTFFLSFFL